MSADDAEADDDNVNDEAFLEVAKHKERKQQSPVALWKQGYVLGGTPFEQHVAYAYCLMQQSHPCARLGAGRTSDWN